MNDDTLTAEDLWGELADKGDYFGTNPVFVACDADPGDVHPITGVRQVGERLVIDIGPRCRPEKETSAP